MLPFLKKSQEASVATNEPVTRKADDSEFDSLEVAAEELIAAVHNNDRKALASALKAAFELCKSDEGNNA